MNTKLNLTSNSQWVRASLLAACAVFAPQTGAAYAGMIIIGQHYLLPNTNGGPGNTIAIVVTGNDTNIQAVDLNVQVGDGGPHAGGSILGPGVSTGLAPAAGIGPFPISNFPGWGGAGYMFAANNAGVIDANNSVGGIFDVDYFGPQLLSQGTQLTGANMVSDVGGVVLALLTFDTTGFSFGSWDLLLIGGNAGDTRLGGPTGAIPLTIINGTISIVPEPGSFVLAAFGLIGAGLYGWRKRSRG